MTKKLTHRGRHTILPIVGDILLEVSLSSRRGPVLIFLATDETQSELQIEDPRLILKRGEHEIQVDRRIAGSTFSPNEWVPLLEALGCEVSDAIAEHDGHLWIEFSNKLVLGVVSTTGYEAWHFYYPRPGRSFVGVQGQTISKHGAAGYLI
jgi:hypothetical protein